MPSRDQLDHPEGEDYLQWQSERAARCEQETDAFIPGAGARVPETWARLGVCLSRLDQLSSCWWGCAEGDHAVEYLVARVIGSIRASIQLARAGLYDEALNALRTAGEIVNLLTLMKADDALLGQWRSAATARERYQLAKPSHVIGRLADLGCGAISLGLEKYDLLSRISHGNTTSAPQAYNAIGLPLTAGRLQPAGFLVVLNEAALLAALAILASVALITLEQSTRRRLLEDSRGLVEHIGAIDLLTVGDALERERVRTLAAIDDELARLADPQAQDPGGH